MTHKPVGPPPAWNGVKSFEGMSEILTLVEKERLAELTKMTPAVGCTDS